MQQLMVKYADLRIFYSFVNYWEIIRFKQTDHLRQLLQLQRFLPKF